MNWLPVYLATALTAFLLGLPLTWAARAVAPRLNLLDRPKSEGHKTHKQATAVAGGMAMWAAWFVTLCLGLLSCGLLATRLPGGVREGLAGIASVRRLMLTIVVVATGLMVAGLLDDRKPMPARLKFLLQFIAAGATACSVRVLAAVYPLPLSWVLTVLWIVTVINAVNFFDNMDGLAGGTGLIALLFIIIAAGCRGQHFVTTLACATAGAAAAFLCFNRPPATIFMGDSGSHFLGYMLALLCILTTFYHHADSPTPFPVLIPLMILAVPLIDAVTVVLIRLRLHKPIYVGDNRHISHRFVQLGLSRPRAVLLVWLLNIAAGCGALSLLWLPPFGALLVTFQFLAVMAVILIVQLSKNTSQNP